MSQVGDKIKIVLATGIFPPDIGGPATFAKALNDELPKQGCEVKVITYGSEKVLNSEIYIIKREQNILMRYWLYFWKTWKLSKRAEVIYAFDLISVGLPCAVVKLLRPKMKLVVRLGGDHLFETALQREWYLGTMKDYYEKKDFNLIERFIYSINQFVLNRCDKVIFNAGFLRDIYVSKRGVPEGKTEIIKNIRPEGNSREEED